MSMEKTPKRPPCGNNAFAGRRSVVDWPAVGMKMPSLRKFGEPVHHIPTTPRT
jgi:hypothetical protein